MQSILFLNMFILPWILVLEITYTAVADAQIRAFQAPESAQVIAGGNITFQCEFPLFQDNSNVSVYWWKLGENEFLKLGSNSRKRFIHLKKGEACLQFLNVSAEDSGVYHCGVKYPGGRIANGTGSKLLIHVPPTPLHIAANEAERNTSASLIVVCKTAEFYPDNINITWYKDGVNIDTGINTVKQLNARGLYEVSSFLEEADSVESGTIFTCQVSHLTVQTAADFRFFSTSTGGGDNVLWYIQVYGSAGVGILVVFLVIIIGKQCPLIKCKGTRDVMERPQHPKVPGSANETAPYAVLNLTRSMKTARAKYQEERTVYAQTKQGTAENNLTYAALELAESKKTEKPKRKVNSSVYAQLPIEAQRGTAKTIYTETKIT
ncbi:tyrosine-protein phosphatase non-receptor type substrate 1-like [Heptranchias perlo]|uniref:tyrosine-protein phosphatase non-receptor type substrate 1-like n=1 Tax=Heptranchias perlo TaxID=212740 RepID=UPI0035599566